jgi:hypothetical protein
MTFNVNQIRNAAIRGNIGNIIIGIIILIIAIIAIHFSNVYAFWSAFLRPPTVLAADEVMDLEPEQLPMFNVSITAEEAFPEVYYTEYAYFEVIRIDRRNYGMLDLDRDDFLLVETSTTMSEEPTFTGALWQMPSDIENEIVREIVAGTRFEVNDFEPILATNVIWTWALGGVVAIGSLFYGLNRVAVGILHIVKPSTHPIYKRLGRYGDSNKVMDELVSDLNVSGEKVGQLTLSKNWVTQSLAGDFVAMKTSDVMWFYKYIIENKRYGVTVSKTFQVYMYNRFGEPTIITAKEKDVDAMLQGLARYAPWAVGGYSPELVNMWQKQNQQFIAGVDQRRAQMSAR